MAAIYRRTGLTWQARQAMAGKLHAAGVVIASGDDAGIAAATARHPRELDSRPGRRGIPAADALASATSVAAHACGLGDRKGRLHTGYDADLIVIGGDPHTDIRALTRSRPFT